MCKSNLSQFIAVIIMTFLFIMCEIYVLPTITLMPMSFKGLMLRRITFRVRMSLWFYLGLKLLERNPRLKDEEET